MFDPYQQYYVSWPANDWDHASICGKFFAIDKKAGNSRVSLWRDGVKQDHCDVAFYAANDEMSHLNFRLTEENKRSVVDAYTGKTQQVQGLQMDVSYCKQQSSGDMVSVCDRANLSPILTGEIAYVSLSDAEKPKTTLNVPALIKGGNLNLAPGWVSAKGCGLPASASQLDPSTGSFFPLQPGPATTCAMALSGGTPGVNVLLEVSFIPNGNIDAASVTCTKDDERPCMGVYVDPNNINLPMPDTI
jgi:hypothetical protein